MGRRGKTQSMEISSSPLTVRLNKNGRPVSETNARLFLAKHYPGKKWLLVRKEDHGLIYKEEGKNGD